MPQWIDQLDDLSNRLDTLDGGMDDTSDDRDDGAALKQTLQQVCAVVREASTQNADDLNKIIAKAESILNKGVNLAYGGDGLFDFLPSFAHGSDSDLVEDRMGVRGFGQGLLDEFVSLFGKHFTRNGAGGIPAELRGPAPWSPHMQPHAKSTRLSRFRSGVVTSVTDAMPLAQAIYQARCEITDDSIASPSRMLMSSGQTCLAVMGAGGWKNRDPILTCYFPGRDDHMQESRSISPGLSEVAYTMAMDEERKLVFVADSYRVKSYSWALGPDASRHDKLPPVHTLDCDNCAGCISVLPDGRLVRAGKGKAYVWNLDTLEEHGPNQKRIGKRRFNYEDSSRDHDTGTEIEDSNGSTAHTSIAFADSKFYPAVWHRHAPSGHMICGTSGHRDNTYVCTSIDLEHGGQFVARYLGHGGDVLDISTSDGDPNAFMTGGSDGYARLFDVRQPLPVVTFNHGDESGYCSSVVLIYPDGVPTLFTGGMNSEQIKMWDIRARKAVYELATGNNAVASMAWDPKRSTLYAATECERMDRMGFTHDYRHARIPRWADIERHDDPAVGPDEDVMGEDGGQMDDDEEDEWDRCWPKKAYHNERYFGYAFDAGEHRLYRHAFKEDPDPTQLPAYGQATVQGDYW
ncbi:hypothetical protein EVJ58_g6993 [Rhodofomes roseus]|uniref:Uncharacterized protein n=1 Tax=Rhodofomes roseus TaxID=34475 RepID=A0A4Y9Y4R5_9APHY|nr:hypothetical protein EVJ58_g6993 [Rhodofomes roseus]